MEIRALVAGAVRAEVIAASSFAFIAVTSKGAKIIS
jgi:hypothetical protein